MINADVQDPIQPQANVEGVGPIEPAEEIKEEVENTEEGETEGREKEAVVDNTGVAEEDPDVPPEEPLKDEE